MSQPVNYAQTFSFTGFQSTNPTTPLPGSQVDKELSAISVCTSQIIKNLGMIQRDDGGVANASIGFAQLKAELLNLFPLLAAPANTFSTITGGTADGLVIGSNVPVQAQSFTPVNSQSATTYTFVLTDNGKLVSSTNGSPVTFTIPKNSTTAFPLYAEISIIQMGAGLLTLAPASGVTLNEAGGVASLAAQYAGAVIKQMAIDSWILLGNL